MALNHGLLLIAVVAAAALVGNASAATYVVGDSLGWTVPPNQGAYAAWAAQHVFRVGDVLVFNFPTGFHDVAHVTKGAFDGCSSTNPIGLATVGPANFTLNSTGSSYYICTFGSHCSSGQKLAINVSASSASPPTPTPTPAPTLTPTPIPIPTPAPSSSPSSPPSPSQSPSGAPSPGPTPSGSATPPPAPGPGMEVPPPVVTGPGGSISPPPPPSSATIASVGAPLVVFALAAFVLMI